MIKRHMTLLLSSYHYFVWLVFIGNSSELLSFHTLSKLIMKPTPPAAAKTLAEFKIIQSFFMKSGSQVPRDESSIDWSTDTPEVQLMPTSRVSPVGRNMLSPHTPLHNRNAKGKERIDSIDSDPSLLNYGGN